MTSYVYAVSISGPHELTIETRLFCVPQVDSIRAKQEQVKQAITVLRVSVSSLPSPAPVRRSWETNKNNKCLQSLMLVGTKTPPKKKEEEEEKKKEVLPPSNTQRGKISPG